MTFDEWWDTRAYQCVVTERNASGEMDRTKAVARAAFEAARDHVSPESDPQPPCKHPITHSGFKCNEVCRHGYDQRHQWEGLESYCAGPQALQDEGEA